MKIRLAHLYPDYLNLYGDFGNLLALRHRARLRGVEVSYQKVSLGDPLRPDDFDFFFIGGGQDQEQKALLQDLFGRKRQALAEAVAMGTPFLCICGGYQLMGRSFLTKSGEGLEGLGHFPVHTKGESRRLIGDVVLRAPSFREEVLGYEGQEWELLFGFENHSGQTELEEGASPLGEVLKGFGNNERDRQEGCVAGNLLGTYLHGSFLPKNPQVTDALLQRILRHRYGEDYVLPAVDHRLEAKARWLEWRRQGLNFSVGEPKEGGSDEWM